MIDGPRIVRGTALALVAVPLLLVGAWVWPPAFRAEHLGRDVALAGAGALCFAAAAACIGFGTLRALQGIAVGRQPVTAIVSGHRRLRIRRPTEADGAADARYYLRIERTGYRPVGVQVDPDVAGSFRVPTEVALWKVGPAVSYRRTEEGSEVVHLGAPALPFPRETESL